MAIKYRVMAMTPADVDFADKIPDLQIICDQKHNAFDTWQRMLESVGDDRAVFLEDDVILCKDFVREIENVIRAYPKAMISFFTLRNISEPKIMRGSDFCMNQCYYLPSGMAKAVREYSDEWLKTERGIANPTGYDYCMADFMKAHKQKYLLWSPSLVQHKQQKSRIDPRRSSKRQAKNFKGDE